MNITVRRRQFMFLVMFLFILLSFLFQLNTDTKPAYASDVLVSVDVVDQVSDQKNLTQPQQTTILASQSKIYPISIVRQLSQIKASKQEAIKPLASWAEKMNNLIDGLVLSWEGKNFEESKKQIDLIGKSIFDLYSLRNTLPVFAQDKIVPTTAKQDATQNEKNDLKVSDDVLSEDYIPNVVAIEELLYGLERRYILWKFALDVEFCEGASVSAILEKSTEDLDKLIRLTLAAEKFLLSNKSKTSSGEKVGELWSGYFGLRDFILGMEGYKKSLQGGSVVSDSQRRVFEGNLDSFCSAVNVILFRFSDPQLTSNQVSYLRSSVLRDWRLELGKWGSDAVLPVVLLSHVERYEDNVGMSNMQRLFRTATQMAFSQSVEARRFGLMVHEIYGGSNIKLYLSKELINHLLPSSQKEVKSFREYIQNQRVVGKRESDFDVRVNFIPDSERLLLSLDVEGSILTSSRANAFATTLFNSGEARCTATKQVELTEGGFRLSPADVRIASNKLRLNGIRTDFDDVPLVSNLVRAIVLSQYELRRGDARKETNYKIRKQVKRRIDQEAESGFVGFNGKFGDLMDVSNNDFGLFIERKGSITEEHWLLTSWAIRSSDILSGNTPAPATLRGSLADMKVHESALNAVISKLGIAGKTDTVGNFRAMLADRFRFKEIAEAGENDDVVIGFDKYNPVVVRFIDGVIELEISIDLLRMDNRKVYRDFQVFIKYEPFYDIDGSLRLRRRGVISLEKAKIGSQIVLRAVFGKIFPEEKTFSLTPKFLKEDKRFEGLTTGLCRIGKGWFAVALVNSDEGENQLISENAPVNQFKRN
ncbi:MAG: hypothetical protein LBH59_10675 [Planctomycetaceae bacterium]|nr:hypothetical protein [Planctomycetaceae bacterium]